MILTRLIVGQLEVNCYILSDDKTGDAVVIDPGDDAEKILRIIRDKGLKVRHIVNTHAHFDHVGANAQIKQATGADIILHEADAQLLSLSTTQAAVFGMKAASSPPADRYVKDGDLIEAGEVSLKVLHTPGHSPGGICLLEQGIVFTGDALFEGSVGRADLFGGDMKALISAIKSKLMTLPDDTRVFPGHGGHTTIGVERKENFFLNEESGF